MKTGILILGHGSKSNDANMELYKIASLLKERYTLDAVEVAFLQLAEPLLYNVITAYAKKGMNKIIIMPYFLYNGNHMKNDIPELLDKAKKEFPKVDIVLTNHIGADDKMADIVYGRIKGYLGIDKQG